MMTPICPKVEKDARYNVKQTAALLGVHPNTVHNYTKAGHLRPVYLASTGLPRYEGAEILRFWKETL